MEFKGKLGVVTFMKAAAHILEAGLTMWFQLLQSRGELQYAEQRILCTWFYRQQIGSNSPSGAWISPITRALNLQMRRINDGLVTDSYSLALLMREAWEVQLFLTNSASARFHLSSVSLTQNSPSGPSPGCAHFGDGRKSSWPKLRRLRVQASGKRLGCRSQTLCSGLQRGGEGRGG